MNNAPCCGDVAQRSMPPSPIEKRICWLGAGILLAVLCLQCLYSAWTLGQTIDETFYSGSGYPIVRYNNYEFLGEHPPLIIQLGALPLLAIRPEFPIKDPSYVPGTDRLDLSRNGARFLYQMGNDPQRILFLERLAVIFLTLFLGFGIFRLGREIYGDRGALLALFLYVFTPAVIGNGSLFMTDMGLTVFYFFSIYALKRFFDGPSAGRITIAGIACGLAFMSKISSLILIPVAASLFLVYCWSQLKALSLPEPSAGFQKTVAAIALFLLANAVGERQAMVLFGPFLLLALYLFGRDLPRLAASRPLRILLRLLALGGAALCAVYSWRLKKKYGIPFAAFTLTGTLVFAGFSVFIARWPSSDDRIRLMKYFLALWVFAALVIVLGYTDIVHKFYRFAGFGNYMKPLGIVLSHSAGGHGACLEESFAPCDWRYFPAVMAVKTPILVLALSGLGALVLCFSRRPALIKAIILIPAVFFLGAAMTSKIRIGLRHILPIFPFLFLLGGLAGAGLSSVRNGLLRKVLGAGLSVALLLFAVRTLQAAPDHLVYINEAASNIKRSSKLTKSKLMRSNWGEDNKGLAEFVLAKKIPGIRIASEAANPDVYDYYKIPWEPIQKDEWAAPPPGFYALGIGAYHAQQDKPRSWFRGKQPLYRVGKTFYIFQVPQERTLT